MKLDDIRKFLEQQKDGKSYLEALNEHLEGLTKAANADKEKIKKLEDEAKKNKTSMEAATAKIEKFADALGVAEDSETLDDDIKAALKTKGGDGDATLQRKIDRLTKQLAESKATMTEQLNAERGKRHDSMIKSALLAELTAQNAVDPSALVDMFRSKVKVGEDDSLIFGENKTIKDGVSAYLQEHPSLVSNKQKPGAGGGNGGGDKDSNALLDMAKALGKSAAGPNAKDDPSATYFK